MSRRYNPGPPSPGSSGHLKIYNRKLWNAAETGDVPACLEAVQAAAEVSSGDPEQAGFTALHIAAMNNHVDVMQYLMRVNANPLYKGQSGMAPLHIAAEKGNDAAVRFLLDAARVQDEDEDYVHSRGPRGWTPFQLGCAHGHLPVAKRLIDAKSDPHGKGPRGLTALHLAAAGGHEGIVSFLVNLEANVDALDHAGRTPLSWGAADGHEAVVRTLLGANASSSIQDKIHFEGDNDLSQHNFAPMHWAACNGHAGVLRQLIKGNADVMLVAGPRRLSALHIAAVCGHDTCVEILVSNGADTELEDAEGNTPIQLSRKTAINKILY